MWLRAQVANNENRTVGKLFSISANVPKCLERFPDATWSDPIHFVCGDRAITESTYSATNPDGSVTCARMVDVFTLKDGKIQVKNAFRKSRPLQSV